MKNVKLSYLAICGLWIGSSIVSAPAIAGQPDLGAQWWQYVASIPASENPLLDETGDKCMVGQHGNLWFLTGSMGSTVHRECTIPEGKTLFFPVINTAQFNSPGVCGQAANDILSFETLKTGASSSINQVLKSDLRVSVDGKSINKIRRIKPQPFEISLPTENIWAPLCQDLVPPGQPAGVFSPAAQDGYYATVTPLNPGDHTLEIHGKIPGQNGDFVVDVTYTLHIIATSSK